MSDIPEGHVIVPSEVLDLLLEVLGRLPDALAGVSGAASQLDRDHRALVPLLTELKARRDSEAAKAIADARAEGYAAGKAEAERAAADRETVPEAVGRGVVEGVRSRGGQAAIAALVIAILGGLAALCARLLGLPLEVLGAG